MADQPDHSVTSTVRQMDDSVQRQLTMRNWCNIALSVLSADSLTRGQVAHECIMYDLSNDVSNAYTQTEMHLVDQLSNMLNLDVEELETAFSEPTTHDARQEWIEWVDASDTYQSGDGRERDIGADAEDKVSHCTLMLLASIDDEMGRYKGQMIQQSLDKLLSSCYTDRVERLHDMQRIQTAILTGDRQHYDDTTLASVDDTDYSDTMQTVISRIESRLADADIDTFSVSTTDTDNGQTQIQHSTEYDDDDVERLYDDEYVRGTDIKDLNVSQSDIDAMDTDAVTTSQRTRLPITRAYLHEHFTTLTADGIESIVGSNWSDMSSASIRNYADDIKSTSRTLADALHDIDCGSTTLQTLLRDDEYDDPDDHYIVNADASDNLIRDAVSHIDDDLADTDISEPKDVSLALDSQLRAYTYHSYESDESIRRDVATIMADIAQLSDEYDIDTDVSFKALHERFSA